MNNQDPKQKTVPFPLDSFFPASNICRDRQDRLNLNQLHQAVGGAPCDHPKKWAREPRTKEFIEYFEENMGRNRPAIVKTKVGEIFAERELALDYAAWVDPKFKIRMYMVVIVIRDRGKNPLTHIEQLEQAMEVGKENKLFRILACGSQEIEGAE